MFHSPSEILATYFISLGLGGLPPLPPSPFSIPPIYDGYFPPEGDFAACVYDTVGTDQGRTMRGGFPAVHPGIQVRIRAPGKVQAFDTIIKFRAALVNLFYAQVTFPDATYCITNADSISFPIRIGQEIGKNRYSYTVNCTVYISQYSGVCDLNATTSTTTSTSTTSTTPQPTTTTTITSTTTTTSH